MKERINKIIESEGLSKNEFALKLNVQRSNITHILDGRNRPSLDFIEKLIKAFPSISTDWLINGTGRMYKHAVSPSLFPETEDNVAKNDVEIKKTPYPVKNTETFTTPKAKEIEKILIIYKDKTFEEYNPA